MQGIPQKLKQAMENKPAEEKAPFAPPPEERQESTATELLPENFPGSAPTEVPKKIEAVSDRDVSENPPEATATNPEDEGEMSLIEHLTELRRRLIHGIWATLVGCIIAYFFLDQLTMWLLEPAGKLYYMRPAEAFFVYTKVVLFTGFLISLPVWFYQAWAFVLPALTLQERMVLAVVVPSSVLLFLGGLFFSFRLVLPLAMEFFMGMGNDDFQPLLSASSYLDFIITFVIPFGLMFEMPLVMVILAQLGIVSSKVLADKFRYVILICFIVGALFTPPDVISQCMLALPMVMLYGVGYLVVKYIMRK